MIHFLNISECNSYHFLNSRSCIKCHLMRDSLVLFQLSLQHFSSACLYFFFYIIIIIFSLTKLYFQYSYGHLFFKTYIFLLFCFQFKFSSTRYISFVYKVPFFSLIEFKRVQLEITLYIFAII